MSDRTKAMTNIILIGMPASGKSTVGVVLAKILGYDFIDTDLLIQRQAGCRLARIIRDRGIDGFLAAEERACLSLLAEHSVIATGGSVVYSEAAMTHLKAIGKLVYLKVDCGVLRSRLIDIEGRGVVLRPGQTLEALFAERATLYDRYADLTVEEGDGTLEDTVKAVAFRLGFRQETKV